MIIFTFAIIFEFALVIFFWSFFLCICFDANDSKTQNFRTLYHEHTNSNLINVSRYNWFTQTKKTQKNYLMRKHELQMKNKIKQKAKKLLKQQKKTRLIKKRIEKYTCRRCKNNTKFDNNIKFHEHIRIRHVKKSKLIVSQISKSKFIFSVSSFFSSFRSLFRSIIFSSFTSSKLLIESLVIFSKFSFETFSESLSIETSKKSIFWTEIVSRSIVAFKFFRFSIATSKSIYNILKKFAICCSFVSFISFRTFASSKFYLIVNDLYRMFVEKSNSFDLQRHRMSSFFSKNFDKCNRKCNFANKYDFIQNRITSYFHAMISFVFKSIKFETFASTHDSIKQSIRTSFFLFRLISRFVSMRFSFSTFSRSFFVCKHCQKRSIIYWFIDWVTLNVSKTENNEIFMKQRYWNFVSSRFILKKYWFLFEKVIILKKLTCCLFVCCFVRSSFLLFVDRSWFEKV